LYSSPTRRRTSPTVRETTLKFFQRLFGARAKDDAAEDHAVLIHIRLAGEWPVDEETAGYHALQDEREAAITGAGAGELDGDEWGGGECVIFTYGPDAEALWESMEPVLEKRSFPKGSYAIKRFGGPGCGREERVDIAWEG
jgi:hypothetical protein